MGRRENEGRTVSLTFVCVFFLMFFFSFSFWVLVCLIVSDKGIGERKRVVEVAVRKFCNSPQLLKYYMVGL